MYLHLPVCAMCDFGLNRVEPTGVELSLSDMNCTEMEGVGFDSDRYVSCQVEAGNVTIHGLGGRGYAFASVPMSSGRYTWKVSVFVCCACRCLCCQCFAMVQYRVCTVFSLLEFVQCKLSAQNIWHMYV